MRSSRNDRPRQSTQDMRQQRVERQLRIQSEETKERFARAAKLRALAGESRLCTREELIAAGVIKTS